MAGMREIRERIASVSEIMKITNAMYLISSSNLKKAKKRLENTEPYFEKLQSTIHHILLAEQEMAKHKNTCLFVVGQIGRHYFSRKNVTIDAEFLYTAQNPTLYRARAIAETVTDLFERKYLDEVYVIYTKMINSMDMEPEMLKLFPLEREDFEHPLQKQDHDIVTFRPSPEKVMDHLVPNYMKGLIFGVLVEAFSSEQNARMTAMSGATTSASEMIKELSLQYNRARQAAITQEITEIVSGANAQKDES